jgi:hypothetical protein
LSKERKEGVIRTKVIEASTFVELDEVTKNAIRVLVKNQMTAEVEYLMSFVACLIITVATAIAGAFYYVAGNVVLGQSLGFPAIAGTLGMIIVMYAHSWK